MTNPHLTYTIQEAAELLKCSVPKVRDMIKDGRIPERYVIEISATDRRINATFFTTDNVTQFPQPISDADVQRIADAVVKRLATNLIGAA